MSTPNFNAESLAFFKEFDVLQTPMTVQHIQLAIEHGYMLGMAHAATIVSDSTIAFAKSKQLADYHTDAKWQGKVG